MFSIGFDVEESITIDRDISEVSNDLCLTNAEVDEMSKCTWGAQYRNSPQFGQIWSLLAVLQ